MIIIWSAYLYYNSCLKSSKRPFPLLFHFAILDTIIVLIINSPLSKILEKYKCQNLKNLGAQVARKIIKIEGWKSREIE